MTALNVTFLSRERKVTKRKGPCPACAGASAFRTGFAETRFAHTVRETLPFKMPMLGAKQRGLQATWRWFERLPGSHLKVRVQSEGFTTRLSALIKLRENVDGLWYQRLQIWSLKAVPYRFKLLIVSVSQIQLNLNIQAASPDAAQARAA
jgi:hypothetical protein